MRYKLIASVAGVALLGGCVNLAPRALTPISLAPTPAAGGTIEAINPATGAAQSFTPGGAVPQHWWTSFESPALNTLVEQALAHNNDLAAAEAALRQAQALAGVAAAARLPVVGVNYQAARVSTSGLVSPPLADPNANLYTIHTAQATITYPIDVFGGVGSKIRSARAAARAQGFRTRAAQTTVVANLVLAVSGQAALDDQLGAAHDSVNAARGVLDLLRRRQQLGAVGAADVSAQETVLATAEGAVPPLERALAHQRALIAALPGVAPGTPVPALPRLAALHLPQDLPISVPSQLVAERPDVRAAQAQMEGAAADVGTAIAARLPGVQLTGNLGGMALQVGEMFASGNLFWQIAGSLSQTLFDGGAALRQKHAADAAFDAAKAQYRASVLQAFVDVSDALTGLNGDGRALDAATHADTAAARTLTYTRRQQELGSVGTFDLLNAQNARAQAAGALVQAKAARLSDTVALYQALGGGVLAH